MGCPQSHEVNAAYSADGSGFLLGSTAASGGLNGVGCCRSTRTSSTVDGQWTGYGRVGGDVGPLALDDEQRRLIKETWTRMSPQLTPIGTQVFLRIFEFRPSVKRMFPFRDAWGDRLIRHPLFLEQARRFMRAVAAVVGSVDTLRTGRAASPALYELGRKHVTIEGFLPDYFDVFTRAVTAVWAQELREDYVDDVADAWGTLFAYIIGQLRDGYDDEWRNTRDLR